MAALTKEKEMVEHWSLKEEDSDTTASHFFKTLALVFLDFPAISSTSYTTSASGSVAGSVCEVLTGEVEIGRDGGKAVRLRGFSKGGEKRVVKIPGFFLGLGARRVSWCPFHFGVTGSVSASIFWTEFKIAPHVLANPKCQLVIKSIRSCS